MCPPQHKATDLHRCNSLLTETCDDTPATNLLSGQQSLIHAALDWLYQHLATRDPIPKEESNECEQLTDALIGQLGLDQHGSPITDQAQPISPTRAARIVATCLFAAVFSGKLDDRTIPILQSIVAPDAKAEALGHLAVHPRVDQPAASQMSQAQHEEPSSDEEEEEGNDAESEEVQARPSQLRVHCDMSELHHLRQQLELSRRQVTEWQSRHAALVHSFGSTRLTSCKQPTSSRPIDRTHQQQSSQAHCHSMTHKVVSSHHHASQASHHHILRSRSTVPTCSKKHRSRCESLPEISFQPHASAAGEIASTPTAQRIEDVEVTRTLELVSPKPLRIEVESSPSVESSTSDRSRVKSRWLNSRPTLGTAQKEEALEGDRVADECDFKSSSMKSKSKSCDCSMLNALRIRATSPSEQDIPFRSVQSCPSRCRIITASGECWLPL